jgi:hypothetical protein
MVKEKICVNFQRIVELFTQKVVIKLSKYNGVLHFYLHL